MTLDVALRNAITGVNVTQRHIEIVSRNVSNLDTPGYTRKIHQQEQRDPSVGGARSTDPVRIIESALQLDLWRQTARVQTFVVRETALSRIDGASANPEDESSMVSLWGRLRESFEALATTPDSLPDQQSVVDRARSFAESVNRLSAIYRDERDRTQTDIAASVNTINGQLAKIAALNDQIVQATLNGRRVPDLQDIRDEAIRRLSEEMELQVVSRGDGSVALFTPNGRTLVDKTAVRLSFSPTATSPGIFYPGGGIEGILVDGDPAADITREVRAGRLAGFIELRDTTLPQFNAQLDEYAYRLAAVLARSPGEAVQPGGGLPLFVDSQTGAVPGFTDAAAPPAVTDLLTATDRRVGFATRIAVNPAFVQDPRLVQRGTAVVGAAQPTGLAPLTNVGTPGAPLAAPSDPTVVRNVMTNVFQSEAIRFDTRFRLDDGTPPTSAVIATGLPDRGTLAVFGREVIAAQAAEKNRTTMAIAGETTFRDTLSNRIADRSKVNLDQEVTLLIQLQQTYGANARVISATQQMFDQLLNAVR